MSIIIRTTFNNQNWNGQCTNAISDKRLFKCQANIVINNDYSVNSEEQCEAEGGGCWETTLCSDFPYWYSTLGNFNRERAMKRAYFIYPKQNKELVLWGKTEILQIIDAELCFKKFTPLSKQIYNLSYKKLRELGVPEWKSGTYRYISEETANKLDLLINS